MSNLIIIPQKVKEIVAVMQDASDEKQTWNYLITCLLTFKWFYNKNYFRFE